MSSKPNDVVEEQSLPLLLRQASPPPIPSLNDTVSVSSSDGPRSSALRNQRLVSLDVFRGLTIAVDDVGGAFPSINHSPWFGVNLTDFVIYQVGIYGVDVVKIRWLGVLQRISRLVIHWLQCQRSGLSEISWLTHKAFARKYYIQGLISIVLCSIYILLLYDLFVPNWEFSVSSTEISASASETQISFVLWIYHELPYLCPRSVVRSMVQRLYSSREWGT